MQLCNTQLSKQHFSMNMHMIVLTTVPGNLNNFFYGQFVFISARVQLEKMSNHITIGENSIVRAYLVRQQHLDQAASSKYQAMTHIIELRHCSFNWQMRWYILNILSSFDLDARFTDVDEMVILKATIFIKQEAKQFKKQDSRATNIALSDC